MKVCQFKLALFMEGGGERVMRALYKTMKAKIYTIRKDIEGEEIEEIGTEAERNLTRMSPIRIGKT